jgi:hypothetical protein
MHKKIFTTTVLLLLFCATSEQTLSVIGTRYTPSTRTLELFFSEQIDSIDTSRTDFSVTNSENSVIPVTPGSLEGSRTVIELIFSGEPAMGRMYSVHWNIRCFITGSPDAGESPADPAERIEVQASGITTVRLE